MGLVLLWLWVVLLVVPTTETARAGSMMVPAWIKIGMVGASTAKAGLDQVAAGRKRCLHGVCKWLRLCMEFCYVANPVLSTCCSLNVVVTSLVL